MATPAFTFEGVIQEHWCVWFWIILGLAECLIYEESVEHTKHFYVILICQASVPEPGPDNLLHFTQWHSLCGIGRLELCSLFLCSALFMPVNFEATKLRLSVRKVLSPRRQQSFSWKMLYSSPSLALCLATWLWLVLFFCFWQRLISKTKGANSANRKLLETMHFPDFF